MFLVRSDPLTTGWLDVCTRPFSVGLCSREGVQSLWHFCFDESLLQLGWIPGGINLAVFMVVKK